MNLRVLTQAGWDAIAWLIAIPLVVYLRFDFAPPGNALATAIATAAVVAVLQISLGVTMRLYRGRYRIASFDEIAGVSVTVATLTIAGTVILFALPTHPLPRTTLILAGTLALTLMLGGRLAWRFHRERIWPSKDGERTLIYGAGDSGAQLVRQMLFDEQTPYTPVGFLDDDPAKAHLRIAGVRVLGQGSDLEHQVARTGAGTLLVARARVSSQELLELDRRCQALGISLRVIPTTSEIVGGAVKIGDITNVSAEDLLGRRPIDTNEKAIRAFIQGKRILITGAGGSIGSELARQVHRYSPAFLGILDRDESGIQLTQLSIDGQGLLTSDGLILADIRDRDRIREVMQEIKPDIVFHAAALKHLTLLEKYPDEGFKTNVEGTRNVLEEAYESGTQVFVNISTDKAADPVSVLGRTKLMTEQLTAGLNGDAPGRRFMSVRFGNVLGSRGSVLNTFRHQIANGGPVTITDPDVTRYFMTISEAVHLVLQAAVLGEDGETLILDMGEPVRIADVAQQLIEKSGRDISIVYTGLRPGEKLEEALVSTGEAVKRPKHPLIAHTRVSKYGPTT